MEKLLTLEDLALRWAVSEKTVARMVREHQIPFITVGLSSATSRGKKNYRFRPQAIAEWEADQEHIHNSASRKPEQHRRANLDADVATWLD